MKSLTKQIKKQRTLGFTILELMVTVGVFVLLSALVLINFKSVDNSLVLRNVASQVSVVVRKAQVQGISVKGLTTNGTEVFPSYGVNFNTTESNAFVLFADDPPLLGNGMFDGTCPTSLECVQRYTLAQGYTIKEICGNQKTGGPLQTCSLTSLDVSFTRPDPEATIIGNPGGVIFSDGEVVIQSRNGSTKRVVVWKTGQISVE